MNNFFAEPNIKSYERSTWHNVPQHGQSLKGKWIDGLGILDLSSTSIRRYVDCVFEIDFSIVMQDRIDGMIFSDCHFLGNVKLQNCRSKKGVSFSNCSFHKDFAIEQGDFVDFLFTCHVAGTMSIIGGKYQILKIGGVSEQGYKAINKLDIRLNTFNGSIYLEHSLVLHLKLFGTILKDSAVYTNRVQIQTLDFSFFSNDGKMKMVNFCIHDSSEPNKEFSITDSNLGKCEFFNLDLSTYSDIYILRSFLIDSIFVDVMWPRSNLKIYDGASKESLRDTYRQLKHIYAKQGDIVTEYAFHEKEMSTLLSVKWTKFLQIFKSSKTNPNRNRTLTRIDMQDILVLGLSKISSNFGSSWVQPLVFLVVVNALIFFLAVYFGGIHNFSIDSTLIYEPTQILLRLQDLIYLSNPLRKLDDKIFIGWGVIADISIRTVSAYSIYNFIRATRRFVK